MSLKDTALLFLLAAVWGASFIWIRVAVPVLGPYPLVAIRVVLGAIILMVYATIIGQNPDWRTHWRKYLVIGITNNVIPFTFISIAQLNMTASLAALLNATTPLFSALIAAVWINDKLTVPKVIGLFLGLVGVGMIVGWQESNLEVTRLTGIFLLLGASLSYGFAGVYGKTAFKGMNPLHTTIGQLGFSSMLMLPLAITNPPTQTITMTAILSVVALGVISTAFAYLIYFYLIESAGPTNAASVTLLVPFFSSLWGAIFLGERLLRNEILGFGVILVSLILVTGLYKRFKREVKLSSV